MSNNFDLVQQAEGTPTSGGGLPKEPQFQAPNRVTENSQNNWAKEEVLRLVQQIFLLQTKEPPRAVVFAGIDHQSGCSNICAAVAETLSKDAGRAVCLVEANFRSPSETGRAQTAHYKGLTDSLLSDEPIRNFIRPGINDKFGLLSSGKLAVDSASLLTSERFRARLLELRGIFDFVIIDAPPLTLYSDAVVLGQLSDGFVLVLEADATRREAASAAATKLRSAQIPILAAVLNKRSFPIPERIYDWL